VRRAGYLLVQSWLVPQYYDFDTHTHKLTHTHTHTKTRNNRAELLGRFTGIEYAKVCSLS